jgi:hypothetical protein
MQLRAYVTAMEMNNSDIWDWEKNDYLRGDRLVCAPNGNGNPEYKTLCFYVQYVIGSWYFCLFVCSVAISRSSLRLRNRLEFTNRFQFDVKPKNRRANARQLEISAKLEQAHIGMLLATTMLMLISSAGVMYPSNQPLGVVSDCLFANTYLWTGQTSFWSRQASLHTRRLLPGDSVLGNQMHMWRSFRNIVDLAEQKLTPLTFGVVVVLVANGVCTRYQLVTFVFACNLVWGFALMHALLFTRLATISNVIRIHNDVGGENAVVRRRQTAVSRMVTNLVLELAFVFLVSVSYPLLLLVFDAHASSTQILVASSIALTLACTGFTCVAMVRLNGLRILKTQLRNATTAVRNPGVQSSACTSSVLEIKSSARLCTPG